MGKLLHFLARVFKVDFVPKSEYLELLARYYHAKGVSNYNLASYCFIRAEHEKKPQVKSRLLHKMHASEYLRKEFYRFETLVQEGHLDTVKRPDPYPVAFGEYIKEAK